MSTSHPKQEAIHFYADGLKIAGHFTPAVGAKSGSRSPTIVCIHGFTTVDTGTVKASNCVASHGIKLPTFTAPSSICDKGLMWIPTA